MIRHERFPRDLPRWSNHGSCSKMILYLAGSACWRTYCWLMLDLLVFCWSILSFAGALGG